MTLEITANYIRLYYIRSCCRGFRKKIMAAAFQRSKTEPIFVLIKKKKIPRLMRLTIKRTRSMIDKN